MNVHKTNTLILCKAASPQSELTAAAERRRMNRSRASTTEIPAPRRAAEHAEPAATYERRSDKHSNFVQTGFAAELARSSRPAAVYECALDQCSNFVQAGFAARRARSSRSAAFHDCARDKHSNFVQSGLAAK